MGAFLWDVRLALGKTGVDPALVGYFSVLTDPKYGIPLTTVAEGLNHIGDSCPTREVRETAYAAVVALAVKAPELETHSQYALGKLSTDLRQPDWYGAAIRHGVTAQAMAPA